MLLTFWGHSCVTIDHEGSRVAVDPGIFSDAQSALEGAAAVLVTHDHVDHVQPEPLAAHLAAHPDVVVHTTAPVVELLAEQGVSRERLHVLTPGETVTVAGLEVAVHGGAHAPIHADVPGTDNVALLLGGAVWHPGDSLEVPPSPVDVLLVPVGGPWLRLGDAIDYVRAAAPARTVPIHFGMFTAAGAVMPQTLVERIGGAPLHRLAVGESLEVG